MARHTNNSEYSASSGINGSASIAAGNLNSWWSSGMPRCPRRPQSRSSKTYGSHMHRVSATYMQTMRFRLKNVLTCNLISVTTALAVITAITQRQHGKTGDSAMPDGYFFWRPRDIRMFRPRLHTRAIEVEPRGVGWVKSLCNFCT
jgi:hypothetical protein